MKHSIWATVLNVLANLVSKFVTQSRLVLADEKTGGYIKVTASLPFVITSASLDESGNLNIKLEREVERDKSSF